MLLTLGGKKKKTWEVAIAAFHISLVSATFTAVFFTAARSVSGFRREALPLVRVCALYYPVWLQRERGGCGLDSHFRTGSPDITMFWLTPSVWRGPAHGVCTPSISPQRHVEPEYNRSLLNSSDLEPVIAVQTQLQSPSSYTWCGLLLFPQGALIRQAREVCRGRGSIHRALASTRTQALAVCLIMMINGGPPHTLMLSHSPLWFLKRLFSFFLFKRSRPPLWVCYSGGDRPLHAANQVEL